MATPSRTQYLHIKRQHPDTLLFYQMGDFYETFDEDAEIVARELEIALTSRGYGDERIPLAGIPLQSLDTHVSKLIKRGYRVAICAQVTDSQTGKMSTRDDVMASRNLSDRELMSGQSGDPMISKGLVEREVIRIVTPGTVLDPAMLAAKRNNFLAAAITGRDAVGLAYIDITTGEFAVTQFSTSEPELALQQEIARVGPAEVLIEADYSYRGNRKRRWLATVMSEKNVTRVGSNGNPKANLEETLATADRHQGREQTSRLDGKISNNATNPLDEDEDDFAPLARVLKGLAGHITPYDTRYFAEDDARHRLLTHFDVASLEGFGCANLPLAIRAGGAVLAYLQETQKGLLRQLTSLETYSITEYMTLDPHTRRNLELFESGRNGTVKGSLLWVLDKTHSPMGGRLIRRWIGQPLLNLSILQSRQEIISELMTDTLLQARLVGGLKKTSDIERLINRVRQRIASPRDLVALASGLRAASEVRASLAAEDKEHMPHFTRLVLRLADNIDIIEQIEAAIVDEPPLTANDGGVIRSGYSSELDQIKDAASGGQRWIAEMEQRERRRTGITNLKVSYTKIFGYFIEITKSNLNRVPDDYIRRQTLTNGERYVTPELKEQEALILNAQERISKLEGELFAQLRARIAQEDSDHILSTSHALAEVDVYLSLAEVAAKHNYCRPTLDEGDTIHIIGGRHPVIEQAQTNVPFIPNDVELSNSQAQLLIITGPNMAGKSTYLRQVALIALMAQIGSYVPADSANIGLVDRIFTRIGAQDDLATGQSTFMVEMVETANILHHATPRSLIILDEIGRGTSTYDGLAIARSVVEYLHNNKRCGARTLFATHYHELVEIARTLPRIKCMNVAVTEEEGRVVFLHKIIPGGADKSYGVHVAQLAGIPKPVIHRAEEILAELERKGETQGRRKAMREMEIPPVMQMTLFTSGPHPLVDDLKHLAIDELTPIEAISKLYELQKRARESS